MIKVLIAVCALTLLAGCQNRAIWNDNGQLKQATEGRTVWDSQGQMETGERKLWVNKDGEDVIQ